MRTNFFPLLGVSAAVLFALALLASGQSSTLTATLAGQIDGCGLPPWLRRLITRLTAIVPALICIIIFGEKYRELACLQPGGLKLAVVVCGVSARAVYKQSSADG